MSNADRNTPGVNRNPSEEELASMSQEQLAELGAKLDDVDIIFRRNRWPEKGTKAEKRAARQISFWFALSGVSGLAFLGVFLFWPWEYRMPGEEGYNLYNWATPLYGLTFGLAILSIGIGAVLIAKKMIPEEIAVQQRHDGPSDAVDQKTTVALLRDAYDTSTIGRRSMIKWSAAFGVGTFAIASPIALAGGMVKNPWAEGDNSPLWTSLWTPSYEGETIYLRRDTGRIDDIALVRPEDIDAGGMETVFPFKESWRNDSYKLLKSFRHEYSPVMLIHLRSSDAARVTKRQGQEDFNYGNFFAFSKICTHLACPTSLYEQQTQRLLCPCHQSQFDVLQYARPVFGPATRALPQLPLAVNEEGYLVARGDFIEPLGPAFWERPNYRERQS
ncbi:Rieske 2Fe-2S domain-containing protein [Hoyosella rhizosphaerae]|uniref:Cytochrome bc1 complex Rieske iron-sulfur subunit n=1 Tax=Hoyosella rhizosphaerae TaxID=1755582 RepID=A0A916UFI9_9ACTN|nr:ubiquinol-cytochrome c reductase iron-sulfur subunit [Hoyosella rhizosphaerae]MBN4927955.1 Rieske 2Fe-2S domain-containing protein [Hoyosella rhizosphaerae]GGC71252.1 putative ubiquinol-cytochrome c reductase iron-sulfur subunit (Rieske iron-sulfur protein) [Hoyosella rhizosphaerae]